MKKYPYITALLVAIVVVAALLVWTSEAKAAYFLTPAAPYGSTAAPVVAEVKIANAESVQKVSTVKKTRAEIRKEKEIAKIVAEIMRLVVKLNALQAAK